jgi:hypothetical protein
VLARQILKRLILPPGAQRIHLRSLPDALCHPEMAAGAEAAAVMLRLR